jgi:hypothetical protein
MAIQLALRLVTGSAIRKAISKDTKPIPREATRQIDKGINDIPKGIKLETNSNAKEVIRKVDKFEDRLTRIIDKGIKQAGFQLLDIIRTKTQKGIDFKGNPFAPYSEGYLKRLQREGKSTNVDLFYTGKMLGSLTPDQAIKKTGKFKITLGFSRAEERKKALFNQVLGTPKREFFGFNKPTEQIINKQFNRFVEKELRKFRI